MCVNKRKTVQLEELGKEDPELVWLYLNVHPKIRRKNKYRLGE